MDETIFPPSPSWYLDKNFDCREDGSVVYGSKDMIVILKTEESTKNIDTLIINNAHKLRIRSVAFSPLNCDESLKNMIASCSDDGLVKMWKIETLSQIMGHTSHWEQKDNFGSVVCLDWSVANPRYIVSAADNKSLVLWDVLANTTMSYSFQNLVITTIACCPHHEKLVAVGVKSGLVNIINLTGKGSIVFRLRGHENAIQSLSWCPTPYNVFKTDEIYEEFLLASASQDKKIFIWKAGSDGKCEAEIFVPNSCLSNKNDEQHHGKVKDSFSFLAVFWSNAYTLYLSSNFGELLYFDVKLYLSNRSRNPESKPSKQSLSSIKVGHHCHSQVVFSIASIPQCGDIVLLKNVEIKSELKFKIKLNTLRFVKSYDPEMENCNVVWEVKIPELQPLLWTASAERKLIACRPNDSKFDIVFNLHTFNGTIYSVVTCPLDPNKIAIGAGDGMIRVWNLLRPPSKITVYWRNIKDRVMSLAWHPVKDGVLAFGTSEGRIGLIDVNTNKLPSLLKPGICQQIYNLTWGPFSRNNSDFSGNKFHLYSIGKNNLLVHDCSNLNADPLNLSKLIPFTCSSQTDISWKPDYSVMAVGNKDGTIHFVEPSEFKIVYTLPVYKKLVQAIAWHPLSTAVDSGLSPYHTYFTAGTTDNTNEIRVFNYVNNYDDEKTRVEQVALLKGHFGHIQFVSWSPHSGCRLVSTSGDHSVQIWDVITESPLVNFSVNAPPLFSVWSPIDPNAIITGCRNSFLCVWRSDRQTKVAPLKNIPTNKKRKNHGGKNQICLAEKNISQEQCNGKTSQVKENAETGVDMAEAKTTVKNAKELKIFSKAWRSGAETDFSACYSILKGEKSELSLSFLREEDSFENFLHSEEKLHESVKHWTEYYELVLWEGRIKEEIEEKMKTGQLNDFLVSLAPTISPRLWQSACLSYSKSLMEKKMFRKAATYLVACHKIYEAITLLKDENLYLEALCLAKCRLPKSDPIVNDIIRCYAEWLFKTGSYLKACECYLYLEEYSEVSKICSKGNHPEYLSLAALAAKKLDSPEVEYSEATNALLQCFKSNNFDLARRICNDHDNLKHLNLLYCMYHTIYQLDRGDIILENDIFTHVKELMGTSEISFQTDIPHIYQKYAFFKSKQEVLVAVAQELFLSFCADNTDEMLTHLIRALSTTCRYLQSSENEVDLLFKLCNWLSPSELLSEKSYFSTKEVNFLPKRESLREFVGAGIVRHLDSNLSADNIMNWIEVLGKLEGSFLNETSFRYFKNLIEVKLCEERLMRYSNEMAQIKVPGLKKSDDWTAERRTDPSKVNDDNSNSGEVKEINPKSNSHNVNGVECEERKVALNSCSTSEETNQVENDLETRDDETNNGEINDKLKDNKNKEKEKKSEESLVALSVDALEEKVFEDKALLSKLNAEIMNYESTKVSSPNPIPVFSLLKKICLSVPESETAQTLLTNLEEKWRKLN